LTRRLNAAQLTTFVLIFVKHLNVAQNDFVRFCAGFVSFVRVEKGKPHKTQTA